MVRSGDLIHKGDSLNTGDHPYHLLVAITGEHQEVQLNVVEEVGTVYMSNSSIMMINGL